MNKNQAPAHYGYNAGPCCALQVFTLPWVNTKPKSMHRPSIIKKPKRKKTALLIVILFILMLIGFTPLENIFPIEIRSSLLLGLTQYTVGLAAFFSLLCMLFIYILRRDNMFSGLMLLLFPFILMPVGVLLVLSFFATPPRWHDDRIYHNQNTYLIMQYKPADDDDIKYRLISTDHPQLIIRPIHILWQKHTEQDDPLYARFQKDTVRYADKIWYKE